MTKESGTEMTVVTVIELD